ncbi:MAG: hypothetical protein COT67_01870 [Candidatus Tagabacteria bacterium CG09_land_8_20_14_0_10_41_14]|uniref:Uncharacterized protein n=2 Tax=Parcubacteria group TaxID=1794811 RepID=A0A2H0WL59_9BACT|nr:MAG: hypothetical protein COX39_01215 [Candidatus Nealsonbacteria bacterium CG23_combo_of_CG06-09_8_20_14_all_40_13]PIR70902.1 MAG: hypothetical protein COU44_02510 [Candidatus Nealsonbacteria bacterium CG10_big_fil_rev_8_21_14_0_10_40_24]PIS13414.1 MAG: hypothetical protein COT67_01870 [Candidatus Tagabacteria bacterium CG09_land_8_20_14_0_10_41_14]PIU43631.1 MAG: hypothetical protein COS97_00020 [Candidatus Nealsonbacteria bacterium CG07_land_8_20_14_0_80_40_10]
MDLGNLQINPISDGTDLISLLTSIVGTILMVAGIIAFLYLIYAGIMYMTAGGDAEKAQGARTAILNTIIGIVVIILSYAIVRYLETEVF